VLFIVTGPAAWIGLRDARSGSLGGGHVVTERDRVLVARARWIRLIDDGHEKLPAGGQIGARWRP